MTKKSDSRSEKQLRDKLSKLQKVAQALTASSAKQVKLNQQYLSGVRDLAKAARRLGWGIHLCTCHRDDDCDCESDLTKRPEDFLLAFGRKGDGRKGDGRNPAVFTPNIPFCIAVQCPPIYVRQDGAICILIGCEVGYGVLTCVALCLTPESPNGSGPL